MGALGGFLMFKGAKAAENRAILGKEYMEQLKARENEWLRVRVRVRELTELSWDSIVYIHYISTSIYINKLYYTVLNW